jgi:bacteriocin-like protein
MTKKSKKTAGPKGVKPGKDDFTLDEKELEKVSGGRNPDCPEIGSGLPGGTKNGIPSPDCSEIGVVGWNCTKAGL